MTADESDYLSDEPLVPGDYVFTFEVSTGQGQTALRKRFDVTFTLLDPCDAPISMRGRGLEDQKYIVTD